MPDKTELFYSKVANEFDELMNQYDLARRLEVIFDQLLHEPMTTNSLLDLGCGNGWFSRLAMSKGFEVYSLDISFAMLENAAERFVGQFVNGSALELPFDNDLFDFVISSEMVEHTPDPQKAILEMTRVLSPGGILALTTPNHRWKWLVDLGTGLGKRPFQGYENFLGFGELKNILLSEGLIIKEHFGFHPWPFQISFLNSLSHKIDNRFGNTIWGQLMINQAICAIKPD